MKTKKRTRRALINSVISLVICFSMLLGTTFAWFTDSVSSVNNKIVAGNLDVELYYQNDEVTEWTSVEDATDGIFKKDALWEPGHTEVVKLKVVNEGSLALKYQLGINIASEIGSINKAGDPFLLSDSIYFGVVDGDQNYTREQAVAAVKDTAEKINVAYGDNDDNNYILEKGQEKYVTLVVYMPTTVGNEANHAKGAVIPTITLGINLFATQKDHEKDSFGSDYDKFADWTGESNSDWYWANPTAEEFILYTAEDLAGLAELVNNGTDTFEGQTIKLGASVDLGNEVWTPIGNNENKWNQKFNGSFIGNGNTIYNLYVTGTTGVGLFGYVGNAAHIEGIVIDGAYVSGTDYVGAVLGTGYLAANCLKNCTVKNAKIIATPYLKDDGVTYDGGAKAGAVAGYAINGNITGNKAIDCTVIAYRDLGGIVGMASAEDHSITVSNNTVENVTLSYNTAISKENYADKKSNENMNNIVGRKGENESKGYFVTVSDNTGETTEASNINCTIISTADDLLALSETKVNGILSFENDIDLNNEEFKAIITARGAALTVLGNGHTVSNLNIVSGNDDNSTGQASMFYTYPGATLNISDLTLKDITVTADENDTGYAAAIVGYCEGSANLDNVDIINASVTGVKSSGMLVGHLSGSLNAEKCDVDGSVTLNTFSGEADGHYAGEYIGTVATSATLNDCTANVEVCGNLKDANVGTPYGRCLGTMIVDGANFVSGDTALDNAIKDGATEIILGNGNYIIPDSAKGKTLTIIGNGETVVATQDDGSYEGCDYSLDGSTVTFENIVINTDSTTYTGYARCNGTYNNCVINGTYTLYGNSEFNNCTFNVSGDVYNIWTWGAEKATFNNCTFNSDGKALLLYGTVNTNLTVNKCTFNDNGGLTDKKAAIEIGNDYGKSYTLTVNNTTVNGYEINDKGISTGTTLWANKNSMSTDVLNVVVDGVDVY